MDIARCLLEKAMHMRRRKVSSETTPPNAPRLRRWIVLVAAILVILFVLLLGRGTLGLWCRSMGAHRMDIWAVSDAQRWLEWSCRLDPENGETDLMKAACFRHLGQKDRWAEAMQSAEQKGVLA
jgi:hypothetical protein